MDIATVDSAARRAWRAVLHVDFGDDDNFFTLSGNSLGAMRVLRQMSAELGVKIPLTVLFRSPRFAMFVSRVASLSGQPTTAEAAPEAPTARSGGALVGTAPVPSPLQVERLLMYAQLGTDSEAMTSYTRVRGPLDPARLHAALRTVVAAHDGLRMRFATTIDPRNLTGGPDDLAHVTVTLAAPADAVSLAVEDCAPGDAQARLTAFAARPHDLRHGPRVRALVLRLADDDWIAGLAVDHIVFDPESMEVFLRQLAEVYADPGTAVAGSVYRDYAARQWAMLDTPEGRRRLRHWADVYRQVGVFPKADLPSLGGAGAGRPGNAVSAYRQLPGTFLDVLRSRATAHRTTLFNVMLTGFALARRRRTGEQPVGVVVSLSDRTDTSTDGTVGLVASALPIWTDLTGATGLADAVPAVTMATATTMDNSIAMVTSACLYGAGVFGPPTSPSDVDPERRGGGPTFEMLIDGPDPEPPLRLPGLACEAFAVPPSSFFMPQGGLMFYGGLSESGVLLALLHPRDAYPTHVVESLLDEIIAVIRE